MPRIPRITEKSVKAKLYTTNEYGIEHQDPEAVLTERETKWLGKNYGVRTDVHRTCINCQARQLFKYKGMKDKKGKPIKDFRVPCSFIPNKLPSGSRAALEQLVHSGMDRDRAMMVIKAPIDPVAWCELMFGFNDKTPEWRLRSYQKEQIRCTSRQLVIREGRRSGKSFAIAVKLLYYIFNMEVSKGFNSEGKEIIVGPEIMIVTPFSSQVANIFDELQKLLRRNEELMEEVSSGVGGNLFTKTPYHLMRFKNKGIIKGFVSGVGTKEDGSGGGTIRGQNAHIIYTDELDMIPSSILEKAVLPVRLTYSKGVFIGTSTPIGKRDRFYRWCLESPKWKEDYLPSTVLPNWDDHKDEAESEGTSETFSAEYLAEFIEGGHGVFKPSYVYGAMADFTYDQTRFSGWWREYARVPNPSKLMKVVGIDWNKNAGTEFCVVAYDPATHRWVVCETINVSASEFSGQKWKEEVVRLNYKWKPDYIYADEGYGHNIIEDLKLWAYQLQSKKGKTLEDLQTVRLVDRLIAYNFSSKVTLRSPVDGTEIQKHSKEFLVENAIRVFEEGRIWFSEQDLVMRKELLNYVVLRFTNTGRPVYGPENSNIGDHRLDALMLALGGLYLQNSLYADKASGTSTPSFLSKERLDKRSFLKQRDNEKSEAAKLISYLEKQPATVPGALTVLGIERPGRIEPTPASNKVAPRRRGKKSNEEGQQVFDYFDERAHNTAGFDWDQEDLYKRPAVRRVQKRAPRKGLRERAKRILRRRR